MNPALVPNLFVVGASKTGTSSLHAYLDRHPEVVGARPKEPCFFVDRAELAAAWPAMARNPVSHDAAAYLAMFAARPARVRFEGSVYYAQAPHFSGVPQRIAAASPEARIIYLVREPVARTVSHYWQRFRMLQETRPIDEALVPGSIYLDTSDYAMQLARYLAAFPRERVKVVVSEELRRDPRGVLADLFGWLGLAPPPDDPGALRAEERHVTADETRVPRFGFVRRARDSAAWQGVRALLPERARRAVARLAVRRVARATFDEHAVRRRLAAHFAQHAGRLDALLGAEVERRWAAAGADQAASARTSR